MARRWFENIRRRGLGGAMAANAGAMRDLAITQFPSVFVGGIPRFAVRTMTGGTSLVLRNVRGGFHGVMTTGTGIALKGMVRKCRVGVHDSFMDFVREGNGSARAIAIQNGELGKRVWQSRA
jgi:hypothetical protein